MYISYKEFHRKMGKYTTHHIRLHSSPCYTLQFSLHDHLHGQSLQKLSSHPDPQHEVHSARQSQAATPPDLPQVGNSLCAICFPLTHASRSFYLSLTRSSNHSSNQQLFSLEEKADAKEMKCPLHHYIVLHTPYINCYQFFTTALVGRYFHILF